MKVSLRPRSGEASLAAEEQIIWHTRPRGPSVPDLLHHGVNAQSAIDRNSEGLSDSFDGQILTWHAENDPPASRPEHAQYS